MFEWKVNQIRLSLMERVLNHMEKQGFEVQTILPIPAPRADPPAEVHVLLAGKKLVSNKPLGAPGGMPAVTPKNIDTVYGR